MADTLLFFAIKRIALLLPAEDAELLNKTLSVYEDKVKEEAESSNKSTEAVALKDSVAENLMYIGHGLRTMQFALNYANGRINDENRHIPEYVAEIAELAYEITHALVSSGLQVSGSRGTKNRFTRFARIGSKGIRFRKFESEIEAIKGKTMSLIKRLKSYSYLFESHGDRHEWIEEKDLWRRRTEDSVDTEQQLLFDGSPHLINEDLIEMDIYEEQLLSCLTSKLADALITIKGEMGSGKTAIAKKMYNCVKVRCSFECLAWTQIKGPSPDLEEVLREILTGLVPKMKDQILKMKHRALEEHILKVVIEKKCLVVIDEVEFENVKNIIMLLFSRNVGYSKIMITSRVFEVGVVHEIRSLDEKESMDLLCKIAPGGKYIYPDETRRRFVEVCNGSRLAITTVGGFMRRNVYNFSELTLRRLFTQTKQVTLDIVLRQLYVEIPYDLRTCLRYLANFSEIQVEKLLLLWIAENLLPPKIVTDDEDYHQLNTLMCVAKLYLIELADKNLVYLKVDEHTGQLKSCRINDLIRNCLVNHSIDNSIQPSDLQKDKSSTTSTPIYSNRSRLAISLDDLDYAKPHILEIFPDLLSAFFIHRARERSKISRTPKSCFTNLKLVTVLDLEGLFISKLDQAIGKLIHLKYLGLKNTVFHKLPSTIQNMSNLQTLDLRHDNTQHGSILVPNVFFRLWKLKHLYLRRIVVAGANKERLQLYGLGNLEILENMDPEQIDVSSLLDLPKHRILKLIISDMSYLWEVVRYITYQDGIKFWALQRLTLSIQNCNFYTPEGQIQLDKIFNQRALFKMSINGRIGVFPEYKHTNCVLLTKLTLESSELLENSMSTLEMFPKLLVLKLKWNAFVGEKMVCKAEGFPQLRFLQLSCLSSLKDWVVYPGAMPNLSTVHIIYCPNLEMIPDGLQSVSTLKLLLIKWMPTSFTDRLTRTEDGSNSGEDYHKVQHASIHIIKNERKNETARKKREVIKEASDMPSRTSYTLDSEDKGKSLMRDSNDEGPSSYPSNEDYDDYAPNEVDHIWQLGYPHTTSLN